MPTKEQTRQIILYIEDDVTIQQEVKAYLEMNGYSVSTVTTSADVKAWIGQQPRFPDLILADLYLPDVQDLSQSVDFYRRLKEAHPQIPFIVLSRASEQFMIELALLHFASDYLTKPYSPRELLLRIQRQLLTKVGFPEGERQPSPALIEPSPLIRLNAIEQWLEMRTSLDAPYQHIELTAAQTQLLSILLEDPGRTYSLDVLEARLAASSEVQEKPHRFQQQIRTLRQKIEADPRNPHLLLHDNQGVGYRFDITGLQRQESSR